MPTRSGTVLKRSRFKIRWNARWACATGAILRLYNSEDEFKSGASCKHEVTVCELIVSAASSSFSSSKRFPFTVIDGSGENLELACESAKELNDWVEYFRQQIFAALHPQRPTPISTPSSNLQDVKQSEEKDSKIALATDSLSSSGIHIVNSPSHNHPHHHRRTSSTASRRSILEPPSSSSSSSSSNARLSVLSSGSDSNSAGLDSASTGSSGAMMKGRKARLSMVASLSSAFASLSPSSSSTSTPKSVLPNGDGSQSKSFRSSSKPTADSPSSSHQASSAADSELSNSFEAQASLLNEQPSSTSEEASNLESKSENEADIAPAVVETVESDSNSITSRDFEHEFQACLHTFRTIAFEQQLHQESTSHDQHHANAAALVQSALPLLRVLREFHEHAVEATQRLVDEYVLPDALKTMQAWMATETPLSTAAPFSSSSSSCLTTSSLDPSSIQTSAHAAVESPADKSSSSRRSSVLLPSFSSRKSLAGNSLNLAITSAELESVKITDGHQNNNDSNDCSHSAGDNDEDDVENDREYHESMRQRLSMLPSPLAIIESSSHAPQQQQQQLQLHLHPEERLYPSVLLHLSTHPHEDAQHCCWMQFRQQIISSSSSVSSSSSATCPSNTSAASGVEDELHAKSCARELHAASALLNDWLRNPTRHHQTQSATSSLSSSSPSPSSQSSSSSRPASSASSLMINGLTLAISCAVDYMGFRVSVSGSITDVEQLFGWDVDSQSFLCIDEDNERVNSLLNSAAQSLHLQAHWINTSSSSANHLKFIPLGSQFKLFESSSSSSSSHSPSSSSSSSSSSTPSSSPSSSSSSSMSSLTYLQFASNPPLPCNLTDTSDPSWRVQTFRHEFLSTLAVPLSSDVFLPETQFPQPPQQSSSSSSSLFVVGAHADRERNELNAIQASAQLMSVITSAAHELLVMPDMLLEGFELCEYIHAKGINCRWLGRLAEVCWQLVMNREVAKKEAHKQDIDRADVPANKDDASLIHRVQRHPLLQLIGSELVARAAKQILRQNLRKVLRLSALPSSVSATDNSQGSGAVDENSEGAFAHQAALLQDAREGIVDFFNLMFGRSQEGDLFWSSSLSKRLRRKFQCHSDDLLMHLLQPSVLHKQRVFMRLQQLCGVLFQPQAEPYPLHDQDSAGDEENDAAYPLSVDDLASIFPRCKTFNIQIWSDQELDEALSAQSWERALELLYVKLEMCDLLSTPPLPRPDYLQTLVQIADVEVKLGRFDEAREALARTFPLTWYYPSVLVSAYLVFARIDFAAQDVDSAHANLDSARKIAVDYFGANTPLLVDIEFNIARFMRSCSCNVSSNDNDHANGMSGELFQYFFSFASEYGNVAEELAVQLNVNSTLLEEIHDFNIELGNDCHP